MHVVMAAVHAHGHTEVSILAVSARYSVTARAAQNSSIWAPKVPILGALQAPLGRPLGAF